MQQHYHEGSIKHITKITRKYENRGFGIHAFHADNAFKSIEDELDPATLHTVAKGEHVPTIERSIRTLKERCRCITAGLPYSNYPAALTRGMVEVAVDALNSFPHEDGVSKDYSPNAIILSKGNVDYNSLKIAFGAYAQVYLETRNYVQPRTVGGIALG